MENSWGYLDGYTMASLDIRLALSDMDLSSETKARQTTPGNDIATRDKDGIKDDSSDYSSSESEDDDDTFIYLNPAPEGPRLDPGSALARYKDDIADAALSRIHSQPGTKSDERTTPDPTLGQVRLSGRQEESGPLACPFYLADPSNHRSCLGHELLRIIDLKRHLWASHRRPYDCPICSTVFATASACDAHIRRGDCVPVEPFPVESPLVDKKFLSDDQFQTLARLSSGRGRSVDQEWVDIWTVVFPGVEPPVTKRDVILTKVGALRRFWREEGRGIVVDFLDERGIMKKTGDVEVLRRLVGERLVARLLDELCERTG